MTYQEERRPGGGFESDGSLRSGSYEASDSDTDSNISSTTFDEYSLYINNYPSSPLFDRDTLFNDHLYCERKYPLSKNEKMIQEWRRNQLLERIRSNSSATSNISDEFSQQETENGKDVGLLVPREKGKLSHGLESSVLPKQIRFHHGMNSSSLSESFDTNQDPSIVMKFNCYYNSTLPLSSGDAYYNWKSYIKSLFKLPITGLTVGFVLDLKSLNEAAYSIGASDECSQIIPRSDKGCPSCPDVLGVITLPESEGGDIFLTIHKDLYFGGETFKLVPDLEVQLTNDIHIWINNSYTFKVHDTMRSAFSNVYYNEHLFLPYDETLIFRATVKSTTQVEIENFGDDVSFKIFHQVSDNSWHFYYVDPFTIKQRTFDFRAVYLHPLGGNDYILNFNFSFPRFVDAKHKTSVNYLKREILAGEGPTPKRVRLWYKNYKDKASDFAILPPFRMKTRVKEDLISLITMSWSWKLLDKAGKGTLKEEDFPIIPQSSKVLGKRMDKYFAHVNEFHNGTRPNLPNLYFHLFKMFYWEVGTTFFVKVIVTILLSVKPLVIGQNHEAGYLVSVYNRDVDRVECALNLIYRGLGPLLYLIINLVILSTIIGWTIVFSFITLVVLFVFIYYMSAKGNQMTVDANIILDDRMKVVREFIGGIRNIKLSNMAAHYLNILDKGTDNFIAKQSKLYIVSRLKAAASNSTSALLAAVTFVAFYLAGNSVDPALIFPAYMYLNSIAAQVYLLNPIITEILNISEAYAILSDFLSSEEIRPPVPKEYKPGVAIKTINVKWKWYDAHYLKKIHDRRMDIVRHGRNRSLDLGDFVENKDTFELEGVNLEIEQGSLVGVVGAAGSGKSTLFNGLVNELQPLEGEVYLNGKIAYATQLPWILMDSIQSNITFGKPLVEDHLIECIQACGLVNDFNDLEDGMFTKIGENGINLSGGQKARVSLARCLYSDADIYLLDDPLAALDAYVGKQVFEQAIKKKLAKKTVLLATHQLQYMQQMDKIIVLDGGRVAEYGTFKELLSNQGGVFSRMMSGYHYDEDALESHSSEIPKVALKMVNVENRTVAEIVKKERKRVGDIELSFYKTLFTGITSVVWYLSVFAGYLLNFVLGFAGLVIMTLWSTDASDSDEQSMFYIKLLVASAIAKVFVNYIFTLVWYNGALDNSKYYFQKMAVSVSNAPIHFFEENPIGRILNRFSKDLGQLNFKLYADVYFLIIYAFSVLGNSILMCVSNKIVIAIMIVSMIGMGFVQRSFDTAKLELSRLFRLTESPTISLISEGLSGCVTIHLLKSDQLMKEKYYHACDTFLSVLHLIWANTYYFELKVSLLTSLITISIVVLAVVFNEHSTLFSALVALALTQSDCSSNDISRLINYIAFNKANMNTLERIVEYCDEIDQEGALNTPIDEKLHSWPSKGDISITRLDISYHSKPEINVLKSLSVDIEAGQRIGVVGRTGSGKSTLALALFRLLEPKAGSIAIDGVDISAVGLSKLRSSIQMISQEANLFAGSVRFNLTLESEIPDEELWIALEKVGLKDYISQLPEKLDYPLLANGSNFSVGQGQLLCLARVIAKKPKVLILDEASSSVDGEADKKIQVVIKDQLQGSTIISIAHRLNTIANFDKIVVLDHGELVQFDSPHSLLENSDSLFSKLVEATGEANSNAIRNIAKASIRKSLYSD
ncbi:Multidrug resistance-associated protein 1 [Boothiomyces sp. JEL0866]|nr:Multidrug resistance-associated protein 1 [Boothiomyces sp. JEL0866]